MKLDSASGLLLVALFAMLPVGTRSFQLAPVSPALHTVSSSQSTPLRILWVGNSLTSHNASHVHEAVPSLPMLMQQMCSAAGCWINNTVIAPSGWLLLQHAWKNSSFRSTVGCQGHLAEAPGAVDFDFVILQDESAVPGGGRVFEKFAGNNYTGLEMDSLGDAYAQTQHKLKSIFAPCIFGADHGSESRAVLYQTWGRVEGDQRNPELFDTFEHMNKLTARGYESFATILKDVAPTPEAVLLAPVGDVRALIKAAVPAYHKFMYASGDSIHPSRLGAYLDACVMFMILKPEATLPDWVPEGVEAFDGALMRSLVRQHVKENRTGFVYPVSSTS